MLSEIRQWNEQTTNLEDTVELLWAAKGIRAEFEAKNAPVPEYLDAQIRALNRAIDSQTRDAKELRLKELRAQAAGLMTTTEKRARVEAELAALEAEIGKA
jgi:hypothetical protein